MKKFLVFASLLAAQTVYAAKPEAPWLLTPQGSVAQPTNLPVVFSWGNATKMKVKNYQFIVSTSSDFGGYNSKTKSCSNKNTCFTTTLTAASYVLRKTNPILKADKNYYWRVVVSTNDGTASSDTAGFSFGTPPTPLDSKYTAVIPKITGTSTDIPTVESGKPIKISALLDSATLPAGYSVKVNYGNGLIAMTNAGTSADVTINPIKSANYTVGIYDAKNTLKSQTKSGSFEVTAAPSSTSNVAPVLSAVSNLSSLTKSGLNNVYTVTLSATDVDGNLRQIFMDWGDNTSEAVDVADDEKVSFSHIYTVANSPKWSATAYDFSELASNVVSQTVTVSAPVVTTTTIPSPSTTPAATPTTVQPVAPPRYTAIDSTGAVATSSLDWACTRDEKTKLIWELKTNNGGLHDKDWTYSWYEPDSAKNGGYAGVENLGTCRGSAKCNTHAFINAVNAEKLCGGDNWRLPTKAELEALVTCSDAKSTTLGVNEQGSICTGLPTSPTIDTTYFPNTPSDWFWTSDTADVPVTDTSKTAVTTTTTTTAATTKSATKTTTKTPTVKPYVNGTSAWDVIFYYGYSRADSKGNAAGVRLVREASVN